MTFDVIIPTFDNRHELAVCLDALGLQTLRDFRVLVCVDGSTDDTVTWLQRQHFPFPLDVLQHEDGLNHGRSAARNLALARVSAPYLCFIDSDLVPHPELLQRHLDVILHRSCISLGDVRYTNAAGNLWAAYAQSRGKHRFADGEEIPPFYLVTGNCAHATEYFTGVGGMDTLFVGYGGEDTDYALRVASAYPVRCIVNNSALCTGVMSKTLTAALEELGEFGRTNLHRLQAKHPGERRMYALHRLTGKRVADVCMRALLLRPLADIGMTLAPYLPLRFALALVHYAVATRIAAGWNEGIRYAAKV